MSLPKFVGTLCSMQGAMHPYLHLASWCCRFVGNKQHANSIASTCPSSQRAHTCICLSCCCAASTCMARATERASLAASFRLASSRRLRSLARKVCKGMQCMVHTHSIINAYTYTHVFVHVMMTICPWQGLPGAIQAYAAATKLAHITLCMVQNGGCAAPNAEVSL